MIDPEIGFTSDVIRDPERFVGRVEVIRDCIKALNSPLGLIAVYEGTVSVNPRYLDRYNRWLLVITLSQERRTFC